MQILIGRLTADAKINQLKDGRAVTNFSIALSSSFKARNGELKKNTTYVSCSYWLNSNLANSLTKSTLVELEGSISINLYLNHQGEAMATLKFHVNQIKFPGNPELTHKSTSLEKYPVNGKGCEEHLPS
ncbi:MAG: single-stranded DNA-binding protein [Williamsia sp.]|nr:single-stranded DNA-binding protein [Williamsia sp.]